MSARTQRLNFLNNPLASGDAPPNVERGGATVTISIASGDTTISNIPVCYVLDKTGVTPAVSYVKSGA